MRNIFESVSKIRQFVMSRRLARYTYLPIFVVYAQQLNLPFRSLFDIFLLAKKIIVPLYRKLKHNKNKAKRGIKFRN